MSGFEWGVYDRGKRGLYVERYHGTQNLAAVAGSLEGAAFFADSINRSGILNLHGWATRRAQQLGLVRGGSHV